MSGQTNSLNNGHSDADARLRRLDNIDLQLVDLLMSGHTSRQSAQILERPVSTIQRRVRLLIQNGALKPTFELGYSRLKIKKGFLHVYLNNGNFSSVVRKLLTFDGIYCAGVHLGNSDVIGTFIFGDSGEVLDLIALAKKMEGVERVVWSEEVYSKSSTPGLARILGNRNSGRSKKNSNKLSL